MTTDSDENRGWLEPVIDPGQIGRDLAVFMEPRPGEDRPGDRARWDAAADLFASIRRREVAVRRRDFFAGRPMGQPDVDDDDESEADDQE